MSKLTDVIDFMGTLTKSEKRYVTLMKIKEEKDGQKNNAYLDLFDVLTPLLKDGEKTQAQLHQEVESLKDKKRKPTLFATTNVLKLHDFLMNCLQQFNADKPDFKLEAAIQHIRILHQKGLYEQALNLIKKIKKEVFERYENEWKAFEIIKEERRIWLSMRDPNYKALARRQQASRIQLQKITSILDTTDDYENILFRIRGHHFLDAFSLSATGQQLKASANVEPDLPFEAKLQGLATLSHYYIYVELDVEKAMAYIQALIEQFEDHKYRKNRYPENYVQTLILFFNRSVQADQVKAFAPIIEKIKGILSENSELFPAAKTDRNQIDLSKGALVQYRLLGIMLHYYNYHWNAPDAAVTIDQAVLLLKRKPNIPDALLITLYFNLASYFVLAGQYEDAQVFLANIFNYYDQKGIQLRKDAIFEADILAAVLLFEQRQTATQKEALEQKLGLLLTNISLQEQEAIKSMARHFISRLNLLIFEKNRAVQLQTFESMLTVLPRKEAAQHGFIVFRLWVEKKVAQYRKK